MKPADIRRLPKELRCKVHPDRLSKFKGLCWGCIKAEQRKKRKTA